MVISEREKQQLQEIMQIAYEKGIETGRKQEAEAQKVRRQYEEMLAMFINNNTRE